VRVLFIHNEYLQAGGEDVAVALESEILREHGHEVKTLFFQNSKPSGIGSKLNTGLRAIYNSRTYRTVHDEIESFKPDLIHIHNLFFVASPSVLFAAQRLKVPVVLTIHNYRLICANAMLLRDGKVCELCVHKKFPLSGIRYKCYHNSGMESAMVTLISSVHKFIGTWKNQVNRFIVPSNFLKNRLVHSSLNVVEDKFLVKPNFIPDPGKGQEEREDFFLFVGRLSSEKGIYTLCDTFQQRPGAKLIIVGDGPDREEVEARFLDSDSVVVKGWMDKPEVLSYMKRCKALIFPSTWFEGLPLTIVESFATGTPIIASKLGAMAEMVGDGYNGFHFEVANSQDLHRKIELFLQLDEKERGQLYENARATYLNKYHPQIHYQTILPLYEHVIGEKSVQDV